VAVRCLGGSAIQFVTRRRYARGIPLVSHMLRLYESPLVDPGNPGRGQLLALREAAGRNAFPWLIFPEGSRTKDGSIGPFKKAGLRAILSARRWSVHLVVTDGFWRCGRLRDFARNVRSVRALVECVGPFVSPSAEGQLDDFIEDLRRRMCSRLDEMRRSAEVPHEVERRGPVGPPGEAGRRCE
jgi:1-acyl-sn-glycerol-3-phosphate acyltransferase